ncbi:hypothetical protein HMPREF9069_00942 [Atopobium sp. oral taxon 810 str. F0209]|nr:hypothetical protein HMPREF9069_00942 [Atopobium sp. oral taxon 810 str. F0209]
MPAILMNSLKSSTPILTHRKYFVPFLSSWKSVKAKKQEQGTYTMLYAQCSQQLGNNDVALRWVEHAEQNLKLRVENRILGCNVRAHIASQNGNYEELACIRAQVETLARTNERADRVSAQMLAWIDFDLAFNAGDWAGCNKAINAMEAAAVTPLQKLECNNDIARLAEAQGNLNLAREIFASIAAQGGDSWVARDAATRINARSAESGISTAAAVQSKYLT